MIVALMPAVQTWLTVSLIVPAMLASLEMEPTVLVRRAGYQVLFRSYNIFWAILVLAGFIECIVYFISHIL